MNDPADNESTQPDVAAADEPTDVVPAGYGTPGMAPTWSWTPPPASPTRPAPGWDWPGHLPPPPFGQAPQAAGKRRRDRALATAAAFVLVAGGAAGGAAFGYAHAGTGSSAAALASGGTGSTSGSPNQSQAPNSAPPSGGVPQLPNQRSGGRASRFATPGHATASQSVGVVDIYTKLKYMGAAAAGTGMILTSNGEVLTNNHVIEGATKIKVVVVSTGTKYAATVVGTDKVDDVAVLQLTSASSLSTVTPSTAAVSVGQSVTAVGNAMGSGGVPSAAKGTIVGINRSITTQSESGVQGERLRNLIEVDAQVIAGDSGGPLYDSSGHVVGMDTAASASPTQSTGFAIPIARALSIAARIESGQAGGNISLGTPPFLGVSFSDSTFNHSGSGAVISGVLPKTPAAEIGLITGDVITNVGGTAITSGAQLHTVLSHFSVGQSVSVSWTDTQGGTHSGMVTLIAGPAQ